MSSRVRLAFGTRGQTHIPSETGMPYLSTLEVVTDLGLQLSWLHNVDKVDSGAYPQCGWPFHHR